MEYERKVRSAASPEALWHAVVDVERWPEMTPSMTSVRRLDSGPLRVGSTARIKQPGQPAAKWAVTEVTAGRSFTWESRMPGLTLAAYHEVVTSAEGTELLVRLTTTGPLAGLVGALIGKRITRFLEMEANGVAAAAGRDAGAL